MVDFEEARFSLTKENVHNWARNQFPLAFRALPRATSFKWIDFDPTNFTISRSVWRSLYRSTHKRLLVIGAYSPGAIDVDEPKDRVVAHVHSDEAQVSFYRITEADDGGEELVSVTSTSSVAFDAPFRHVGDDGGNSKAIHRVSALILYYFLATGHVAELQRTKSDPTMFTRNFKDACFWVENGGSRPIAPPSRLSSTVTTAESITVRPTRASTIATVSRSSTESSWAPPPPINRAMTDNLDIKRKRHDTDDGSMPHPRKHPRRTLSEQIQIPKSFGSETLSPRTPPPERVNSALQDRISSYRVETAGLKEQIASLEEDNADLKKEKETQQLRMEQEANGYKLTLEQLQAQVENLMKEVEKAKQDAAAAKSDAASVKAEMFDMRKNLAKKQKRGGGK